MGHTDAVDAEKVDAEKVDAEKVDSVVGFEIVDALFWALVCDDEDWLRAEFDGIVSEPAELRPAPPRRLAVTAAVNGRRPWSAVRPARAGCGRPWRRQGRPGRAWRRQRGPPDR